MASDCAAATAGVHSSTTASRRQFFANDTAEYGDAQASRRHRSLASSIRPWLSFHANRQCYERPRGAQKLRPLRTSETGAGQLVGNRGSKGKAPSAERPLV